MPASGSTGPRRCTRLSRELADVRKPRRSQLGIATPAHRRARTRRGPVFLDGVDGARAEPPMAGRRSLREPGCPGGRDLGLRERRERRLGHPSLRRSRGPGGAAEELRPDPRRGRHPPRLRTTTCCRRRSGRPCEALAGSGGGGVRADHPRQAHEQARVEVEAERLRTALLSSLSHDLRTPLGSIEGAASSLLQESGGLSPEPGGRWRRPFWRSPAG